MHVVHFSLQEKLIELLQKYTQTRQRLYFVLVLTKAIQLFLYCCDPSLFTITLVFVETIPNNIVIKEN